MFKARIKADSLKEFIGTVGSLVDEAKLNVNEDGIQIKAVDPSHVAMIETNLVKSAFDSYEANAMEMGLDIDKFKNVLTVAGKEDMVELEKDDDLNRLVVNIGNLTRAMPLLDTSGMPDPKVPSLDSSEDATSLFSLEYFALMVNSLPADRILHINLGSDLPVKIDADLAVDDMSGAQGNVKFLLAPRIDRD